MLGKSNFTTSSCDTGPSGTCQAWGVSYDAHNHRLFVADSAYGSNNRVLVFNVATSTIMNGENAENVIGQPDYTTQTFQTTQSGFQTNTFDVVYDPTNDRLFLGDQLNNRVMIFNVATSTITNGEDAIGELGHYDQNGDPIYTVGGANNGLSATTFNYPAGVTLDTVNHRLFVDDSNNNRELVFQLDAHENVTTPSAAYVLGQSDFTSNNTTTPTQSGMHGPFGGSAYDAANQRLFVPDNNNNRILVFNVATSTIANGENASYVLGQSDFISNNTTTPTQSGIANPEGLAYDPTTHYLFVPEYNNNRILVFNVATSTIANGENASYVLGQTDFISNTATTTQSGMDGPYGAALDATTERLFISDSKNNRILSFNVASGTISNGENALNVLGQSDFISSGDTIAQNTIPNPEDLILEPTTERLFASDDNDNRLMVFGVATSTIMNNEDALNVIGQPDFASGNANTTQSGINDPEGNGSYDPVSHQLFVPDSSNNRVMVFTFISLTTPSFPRGTAGSSYSTTLTTQNSQRTVSFAVPSGSLPAGLSLATSTGVISGTPTTAGMSSFTIEADDGFSTGNFFDREPYMITIASAPATSPAPSTIVSVAGSYAPPGWQIGSVAPTASSTTSASSSMTHRPIKHGHFNVFPPG